MFKESKNIQPSSLKLKFNHFILDSQYAQAGVEFNICIKVEPVISSDDHKLSYFYVC